MTVLFADMTGSTSLEEEMDAEAVRALVDRFYRVLRAEVEKHSGRVVKFTGDGLMAAFGVPEVHEDDALRAVQTALAMCSACADLAAETGRTSLALKVGVNTGEVVVIEDEDDVVGDAVNVASRLEGAATPGEVLVGEGTWRLTRAECSYEPIDPLVLKGKTEPVPAFRLVSVDDGTPDTFATPFVGREAELRELLDVFDDAVAANEARLVTIVGSPGLGKTRLTRELASRLADRAVVRETRCDPASATFAPIAEALREANEIPEAADEAEILEALLARIPEEEPERERIAERAAAILGAGQPGSTEETFWALRRMIASAAAHDRPRVIVLEDLHWAEPLLLDLVEHLAEWIRDAPVLLVGTARPELREVRPSLVEGGRASAVIALEGLDEADTARLALGLLGGEQVPSELLRKIPATTEGNPLFVREFVRMLVEDGVLQRTGDGWSVTVDVEAIQVPPTIQSLLAARVDRLRSDERSVVELAAVIGKEFYRGALHELASPALREQVDACLESLRRKELVEPAGTYWIDEPVYRFHHVLIRDAAYRRVLKETRAELHERVAEWLEQKTADVLGEHEELIGFHLEQAHEYERQLGRTNEELGRRAAHLLSVAAQRALDRDDLPAAASLSARALARLPETGDDRAELLLIRCEALLSMGDVTSGAAAAGELEQLATSPRLSAWATCFAGHLANLTAPERLQETEKRVAAAASELSDLGDPAGAAKAHTVHGATLARLGRFGECETALDEALTAAREAGDRRRITAVLGSAPLAALWGPNPVSRAGGRCLDLVRLSRITTGSPGVEVTSLRCQAVLEAFRGRADAARRMLRSAKRTLTELGLRYELLETEQFAGIVELVAGAPAAALERLREAHDGFRFVGVDVLAAQTAALLARAHLLLGEDEQAERFAAESEELGGQDLKASIAWRAVKAELLARRGELDDARALAERAVELAARTDALIDHGDACRALAAVCAAAGDAAAARQASDRAFALYERKGATALLESAEPTTVTQPTADRVATDAGTSNENDCVRVLREFLRSFEDRDWDKVVSLHREDFTMYDRRVGLAMTYRGRDAQLEDIKATAEVGTTNAELTPIAVRGDRLSLVSSVWRGPTDTAFGSEFLAVSEIDEQGRIYEIVVFGLDDRDAAFAELDERFAAGGSAANRADKVVSAFCSALSRADLDGLSELLSEDVRYEDRRRVLRDEAVGRDAFVGVYRDVAGGARIERSTIAVRGERLVLSRVLFREAEGRPDPFVIEFLWLHEIDDEGRIWADVAFDPDALDAAIAELDERFVAGEGAQAQNVVRVCRAFARTYNSRDWEGLRALFADDCAVVDRRLAALGPITPDELIRAMQELIELIPGRLGLMVSYPALAPNMAVALYEMSGPTADGAEIRETFCHVWQLEGDRPSRFEFYPEEGLDDALARFEELRRTAGTLENDATRASQALGRAFERREWNAFARLFAEEARFDDRRRLIADPGARNRSAVVEVAKTVAATGVIRVEGTPLAVRGERLMLGRALLLGRELGSGAFETELLQVFELDDRGLIRSWLAFDAHDFDGAFAELDERYIAGEGAPYAGVLSVLVALIRALNQHDWEGMRLLYADDARVDDHRPVSLGTLDADFHIESLRELVGLFQFRAAVVALHALDSDRIVFEQLNRGVTSEGAAIEITFQNVMQVRDGRLLRWEFFPVDKLDAALARFEELERAAGHFSNDATRAWHALEAAFETRDWDAAEQLFSSDFVREDRRHGVQHAGDEVSVVEALKVWADLGMNKLEIVPIATRGESLALGRLVLTDSAGNEVVANVVYEADGAGRLLSGVNFDADDLDGTFAELDERYIAGEGKPFERLVRLGIRFVDAMNTGDLDFVRAIFAEDVISVDHRPAAYGQMKGVEAVIDIMAPLAAIGARTEMIEVLGICEVAACVSLLARGSLNESEYEWPFLVVLVSDGERIVRDEVFPIEMRVAALARFDELARTAGAGENDCARVERSLRDRFAARDWAGLAELHDPDHAFVDRRPLGQEAVVGRGPMVDAWKGVADVGVTRIESSLLATRGSRLALQLVDFHGSDPASDAFATQLLRLAELGDDGLLKAAVVFDSGDLRSAIDELDRRFTESELGIAPFREVPDALNNADWAGLSRRVADDFVVVDHRPASLGELHGADQYINSVRALRELFDDFFIYISFLHAYHAGGGVFECVVTGSAGDGSPVEIRFLTVGVVDRRQIKRNEYYPLEQLETALARFDELTDESVAEASAAENAASSCTARIVDAVNAADWEGLARLLAEDLRIEDRRAGVVSTGRGPETWISNMRAFRDLGLRFIDHRAIATRGDLISLSRESMADGDGNTIESASIVETNAAGRAVRIIILDPDDLDTAYAALDERYLAGEGASYAEVWRPTRDLIEAQNNQEWTRMRNGLTDDFVLVDHRPVGFGSLTLGSLDRDDFVRAQQSLAELVPDFRFMFTAVDKLTETGAFVRTANTGTDGEGNPVEIVFEAAIRVRDSRVETIEVFPVEQHDAALARFEEMARTFSDSAGPTNACSRLIAEWSRAFHAHDWDALSRLCADDIALDDRRLGLRNHLIGKSQYIEQQKIVADLGAEIEYTILATRGERLDLGRTSTRAADPARGNFEVVTLCINEIDDDGLLCTEVHFSENDLESAFAELERLFLAGEAAEHAHTWNHFVRFHRAMNARDWEAARATYADDFQLVDHRPASLGRISGGGQMVEAARTLAEVVPDMHWLIKDAVRLADDRTLNRMRLSGTNEGGGAMELEFLVLLTTQRGVTARMEFFPEEQLEAAIARFEELGTEPRIPSPDNAATRSCLITARAIRDGDWATARRWLADDLVIEDRRPGVGSTGVGADAWIDNFRAVRELGPIREEVIATRGERLALTQLAAVDEAENEREALAVSETNDAGRLQRIVYFYPADLDSAFAELEERYIAGEGRPYEEILRLYKDQTHAYNARDWDAFRASFHDDYVMVDHRPAGAGTLVGIEEQVQYVQTLIEMAPDARLSMPEIISSAPDRMIVRQRVHGTTVQGAEVELMFLGVALQRDGRHAKLDVFPADQLEAANARFEELGPQGEESMPTLNNACTQIARRVLELFETRHWDRMDELLAEDVLADDRRRGLQSTLRGRAAVVDQFRTIAELGAATVSFEPIAVRGERLALVRRGLQIEEGPSGFSVEWLGVDETGADGRAVASVAFDADDLDTAFAELEERYMAGEGAPFAELWGETLAALEAHNRRDWDALRAFFADDFAYVDHRPASLGRMDAEGLVTASAQLVEVIPDLRLRPLEIYAIDRDRYVSLVVGEGHDLEGGEVHVPFVAVARVPDGRATNLEFFPLERLQEALARFEEFRIRDRDQLENNATRVAFQGNELIRDGAWERAASLVADDVTLDDRRTGVASKGRGRNAWIANFRAVHDLGLTQTTGQVVAIRGDRLALISGTAADTSGNEMSVLSVIELDDSGRASRMAWFDPDDLDAAFAELDKRYLASGEADELARAWIAFLAANNDRDWDAVASCLHEHVTLTDHRPVGWGSVAGRDAILESLRGGADVASDRKSRWIASYDARPGQVYLNRNYGTDDYGNAVEWERFFVGHLRDGKIDVAEVFPPTQFEDALARARELTVPSQAHENECSRLMFGTSRAAFERRWDDVAANFAEDVIGEDRRRGLGGRAIGRDQNVEMLKVVVDLGAVSADISTIATRGNRLALFRVVVRGEDQGFGANEVEFLALNELNDQGQHWRAFTFDPDDLDAAFEELDQRYLASVEATELERVWIEWVRAYNDRDWARLRSLMTDDCVFEDHRPAGWGAVDVDGYLDLARTVIELSHDRRMRILWRKSGPSGGDVIATRADGTDEHGNRVEWGGFDVVCVQEGRLSRIEIFPTERFADAVARAGELAQI